MKLNNLFLYLLLIVIIFLIFSKQKTNKIKPIETIKPQPQKLSQALNNVTGKEKIEFEETIITKFSKDIISSELKQTLSYILQSILDKLNKMTKKNYELTSFDHVTKIINKKNDKEEMYQIDFFITDATDFVVRKFFCEIYYNNSTNDIKVNQINESNWINQKNILLNYPRNSNFDKDYTVDKMQNKYSKDNSKIKGILNQEYDTIKFESNNKPNISIVRNKWILNDQMKQAKSLYKGNQYELTKPKYIKKRSPGFLPNCL